MKLASHVENFRHFGFRNFRRNRGCCNRASAHTIPESSMDYLKIKVVHASCDFKLEPFLHGDLKAGCRS